MKKPLTALTCNACQNPYAVKLLHKKTKSNPLCKKCRTKHHNLKWKNAIKKYSKLPQAKAKAREWRLKTYYDLSSEQYDMLLHLQDNVCAICKIATIGDNSKYLCIDHDHTTGKVRGLLCDKCNRAIGSLRENPKILQNAILYLIKSEGDKSWHRYFINIASLISSRSKDLSTQVGAVLVKDRTIIGTGYNGFPRGCDDSKLSRLNRPDKYLWTCHAEENALLSAARFGVSTQDSTLYVTPMYPCAKCTRAMIQCGVKKIIAESVINKPKWMEEFTISKQMMREASVEFLEL